MILATLTSALLLAQLPVTRYLPPRDVVGVPVCESCGVRLAAIGSTIDRLKASPRPHVRADAAADLARVRWTCHPEVVLALSDALLFDRKDDVREQAAESLARLGACDPVAHLSLRRAAMTDRDGEVRQEARKALASLPARCVADCPLCGPLSASSPEGLAGRRKDGPGIGHDHRDRTLARPRAGRTAVGSPAGGRSPAAADPGSLADPFDPGRASRTGERNAARPRAGPGRLARHHLDAGARRTGPPVERQAGDCADGSAPAGRPIPLRSGRKSSGTDHPSGDGRSRRFSVSDLPGASRRHS